MEAFEIHRRLIEDYRRFTGSFVDPADERVRDFLEHESAQRRQRPAPWLSLNPSFAAGGSVDELGAEGLLHPDAARVFRGKRDRDSPGTEFVSTLNPPPGFGPRHPDKEHQ